jgi:amidophosphoribosyltransferase
MGKLMNCPFSNPASAARALSNASTFSRGNDREIYQERKKLGELLARPVLEAVNFDLKHTVFSYIPNTAEAAYYGLMEGFEKELNVWKQEQLHCFRSRYHS